VAYTWDDSGNLLSDGVHTFSYDAADRLVGVSGPGLTAGYTYNGDGLRVASTVNGVPTTYTWDVSGDVVAGGLPQVLMEGSYAYGYGYLLLGRIDLGTGQLLVPMPDGLGSVRLLVDYDTRQVVDTYRYAPFGGLLAGGVSDNRFRFTGQWQEEATGLYYLRARWYDPATGRFLTRDPVPGLPSVPASLHPYVYALNNPVLYTDPGGEIVPLLLLGAAIGGGLAAFNYFQAQPCATLSSALQDPGFLRAVLIGAGVGAVGGLVGFGIGAFGAGAFGGGLMGAVITGAVAGGAAGGVTEALTQVATYGRVRNPQLVGAAMLSGVVSGGVLGGVGYGIGRLARPAVATGAAREAQSLIDDIVQTELKNVRLSQYPQYNPNIPSDIYGLARRSAFTQVGPQAIQEGRGETLITIVHEEMHHRLWTRGVPTHLHHPYVENVAQRFARLKGW